MTVLRPSPNDLSALWPFARALYGAPGVSGGAIMLQDRHGVDVNMMLFLCWRAGFAGGLMDEGDLSAAIAASRFLQEETIRPLRDRRRSILKGGAGESERQLLLSLELAAEKAELAVLEHLWRGEKQKLEDGHVIRETALANLRLYVAGHGSIPGDEEAEDTLAQIAGAAVAVHLAGG